MNVILYFRADSFFLKDDTMKLTVILFPFLFLGLMMGSCHSGQKVPEGEFLIEGFVKNLPDSSIVSLCQSENRQYADIVTSVRLRMACLY